MPEASGQAEVIAFLSSPDTFGQPVERLDTHSAAVFLVNPQAELVAVFGTPHEAAVMADDYQRIVAAAG